VDLLDVWKRVKVKLFPCLIKLHAVKKWASMIMYCISTPNHDWSRRRSSYLITMTKLHVLMIFTCESISGSGQEILPFWKTRNPALGPIQPPTYLYCRCFSFPVGRWSCWSVVTNPPSVCKIRNMLRCTRGQHRNFVTCLPWTCCPVSREICKVNQSRYRPGVAQRVPGS